MSHVQIILGVHNSYGRTMSQVKILLGVNNFCVRIVHTDERQIDPLLVNYEIDLLELIDFKTDYQFLKKAKKNYNEVQKNKLNKYRLKIKKI